ncbi:helix-turn-helix domain-containing protein [Salinigranum marinum]|uniref:helix-turn-helix domain-containing protein n=1 Tax=Salinigranum marinum TaxID=1515595 RepID=UPI002989B686|nr:helix-turn-helix domain-containing protein [Salinigranum marinum]
MEYKANRRVEASARTFAIVEHLSTVDSVGVSTLASELEMSKGIMHNHLSTLRELGYVTKVGDEYQLSPKFLAVGLRARSRSKLYHLADGLLNEFAERHEVGTVLLQAAGNECCVVAANGVSSTVGVTVGTSLSLTDSLLGLVILVERAADETTPIETAYDLDEIRMSLDESRYAVGSVSTDTALECIALPITDDTDECRGSVGILLPSGHHQQRLEQLLEGATSLQERIETRFSSGWTTERSFATEKHSWAE